MKKIIIVVVPILVIATLLWVFVFKKEAKAQGKYTTAEVKKGTISIIVTATGSLEAVKTVQVGSQVSGTILALYADFNSQVKKGEVVAQLDPAFLKAQVVQAQADLDKSIASADLSKKQYDRAVSLFAANLISESDKETALTNYDLAQADVKSSQANLERLKTNLDYATISSPIDGVVISRNVDVGQTVAASLSAPTIFTIAQDLTKMQVDASIDEADIGNIKEGQDVIFTVDAYAERSFNGKVKQVRLSPTITQNVVSYDVIIEVSNPDLLLKPGMTANVTIQIDRRDDILKVPSAALRYRPANSAKSSVSGGAIAAKPAGNGAVPDSTRKSSWGRADSNGAKKGMIWKLDSPGTPQPIPVLIGLSDGTSTQVISDNLAAGDTIITGQEGVAQNANTSQEVNPFLPRFGGGGRR
jgi:HlyD family secretion protein